MNPPSNTNFLLSKILQCPNEENYSKMIDFISTIGLKDFISSIENNNPLSLIFLKNYVQKWIDSKILNNFYSEDFILFLIECCNNGKISKNNWTHICDFLEILSNKDLISENTVKILINQASHTAAQTAFQFLDAIFKKYTIQPRSNQLFIEIKRNIELFFPIFIELLFDPTVINEIEREYTRTIQNEQLIHSFNKPKIEMNQEYILSIFYSLTYQDIHPLFEDNIEYFFKVFFILFNQNQQIINKIFDLFISKYPEITNFDLIILTLTRVDSLDGLIVNTLTNAFGYAKRHSNVIVSFLKRTLEIEMDEDWISTTQNIVRGNDIQRGFVHKLIRLLNCNPDDFEGESILFVATVLKTREKRDLAVSIIQSNNASYYEKMAFTAFRYLITIQEYVPCNLKYLDLNTKFICMKYLSNLIKSKDNFHKESIFTNHNIKTVKKIHEELNNINLKMILSQLEETLDEFSSELLFRMVKTDKKFLIDELYNFILRLFQNLINIPHTSLVYLFDIFISLSIKLKKYNLQLIETILNGEMIDLYNLCFLYVSVLIKETDIKTSFILHVLSQNELWNTKELHPGMSFILISSVEKGIITKTQAEKAISFLDGYFKIIVQYKLGLLNDGVNTVEEKYILNGEFEGNWFIENFINKKYSRLIIKKMMKDERIADSIKQMIIEKNMGSIENEIVLHSIVEYFDI